MENLDWMDIHTHILELEERGLVTRTFRRLDPERQRAVLGAVLDEAVEKGPTSLNIKQVAERAGVSVGALYTYFDSRDNLLEFAVELCVRFMNDALNSFRPYLRDLPLREALSTYLVGGVEWSQTQAGLLQFFARGAYQGDPELSERMVRPVAATLREIVREMLVQAVERGEVRPDLDLEAAARVIHALTVAVGDSQLLPYLNTYFQVTAEEVSLERVLETLLDLVMSGIGLETVPDTAACPVE